ncbi:MAG: DUF4258 domain-containing protein [Calditrichales bacterium]|nr:DUF4258 domain-containing protein [Calditrichales bacterium]
MNEFHNTIKEKAKKRILYTLHAVKQMNSEKRLISVKEVEFKISAGEIIEDYPEDKRGHSCLIDGLINLRPVHIVCAPKDDYLAIITAYLPDSERWDEYFKKRKNL